CADFELTERACKHMLAVKMWVEQGTADQPHAPYRRKRDGEPSSVEPPPDAPATTPRKTYKQDWPNYNKAQTREKNHVRGLLADLCAGLPGPTSQRGTKG